jgi:hypothetical protein
LAETWTIVATLCGDVATTALTSASVPLPFDTWSAVSSPLATLTTRDLTIAAGPRPLLAGVDLVLLLEAVGIDRVVEVEAGQVRERP